jgi:hypothetical protein
MNSIGLSSCYVTVNNYKQKFVLEHLTKIREFFSEQVSIYLTKKTNFNI